MIGGGLYMAAAIFILILAACWIVLPFALIGIKPLLREIRDELRTLNAGRSAGRQAAPPARAGGDHRDARVPDWAGREDAGSSPSRAARAMTGLPPT